jgi:poly(ADP-ribose) glycohydrolase
MLLPSSPHRLCLDRFSLTDLDMDLVPCWSIIQAVTAVLPKSPLELIEQLEIISVTFRGSSCSNFVYLKLFLLNVWGDSQKFLNETWPKCVQLALEMPVLFPSGCLLPLTQKAPIQQYTTRQVACLVIHQFLCTLDRPSWMQDDGSPDFHIWFGDEQPHPNAVHAYLYALFTYFDRIAADSPTSSHSISFMLRSSALPPIYSPSRRFTKFTIHERSTPGMIPSLLGLPSGACVISANKYIGFGRTGTQEEMHVGSTPEACPAVLITQPLADGEVMVVLGAKSMIEMEGYGREAKLSAVLKKSSWDWRARTMLFMDALEFDSFETGAGLSVPDLLPGNVDRELTKAYTAFSSGQPLIAVNPSAARYTEVVTGLWGCRAFGGNKEIKTVIQWCAASLADVPLAFVCEAASTLLVFFVSLWLILCFLITERS